MPHRMSTGSESISSNGSTTSSQQAQDADIPARLVFMGDGRVGLTALVKRYTTGVYTEKYKPEIAKVMRHTKHIYHKELDCDVSVQFWDVEGADLQTALMCAQRAHAVAVVYDVTNRSSFELAQLMLDNVNPRASSLLIGNKFDVSDQRKVSLEEGRLLAKIHRVEFVETSAKLNTNVDKAFDLLISCVPHEYLRSKGMNNNATKRWQKMCTLCSSKLSINEKPSSPGNRSVTSLKKSGRQRRSCLSESYLPDKVPVSPVSSASPVSDREGARNSLLVRRNSQKRNKLKKDNMELKVQHGKSRSKSSS